MAEVLPWLNLLLLPMLYFVIDTKVQLGVLCERSKAHHDRIERIEEQVQK